MSKILEGDERATCSYGATLPSAESSKCKGCSQVSRISEALVSGASCLRKVAGGKDEEEGRGHIRRAVQMIGELWLFL